MCVACLRVLRQISVKDAHNVQRDGVAFGKRETLIRWGLLVLDFSLFLPTMHLGWGDQVCRWLGAMHTLVVKVSWQASLVVLQILFSHS